MTWHDLWLYWRKKHVGGKPPARADLDPLTEIPKLVSKIFLFDVVGETFKARLVGSEITARGNRDITGALVDEVEFVEPLISQWTRILRGAVRECRPAAFLYVPGRFSALEAFGIALPLVDDEFHVEMLLGGLFFDDALVSGRRHAYATHRIIEYAISDDVGDGTASRTEIDRRSPWGAGLSAPPDSQDCSEISGEVRARSGRMR